MHEDQLRPSNFVDELKNISFKEALINFFINDWGSAHMAEFLANKTVYVSYDLCYKYEVINMHVLEQSRIAYPVQYTKKQTLGSSFMLVK